MAKLPRFFIKKNKIHRGKAILHGDDVIHKIRQVLRMRVGDKLVLFDGAGEEYLCEIKSLDKEGVRLEVMESRVKESNTKYKLYLAQALPKAGKFDEIIRMNTEVGVEGFIPFEADYSVFKLDKFKTSKLDRWSKIAHEAARQSERSSIPTIEKAITFEELMQFDADVKVLLHSREQEGASKDIYEIKNSLEDGQSVLLAIGPEGGFSPKEVNKAVENGWKLVFINLPILRTETAGVIASGILLS